MRLTFDWGSGVFTTAYEDGGVSSCGVTTEDYFHGRRLGVSAKRHRLLHEALHHWVGIHVYGLDGSCVIRQAAHNLPQESLAGDKEWLVTCLTYYLNGMLTQHDGWLIEPVMTRIELATKRRLTPEAIRAEALASVIFTGDEQ